MRTVRWLTVIAVAWLVIVHGVPMPRLVRTAQDQIVPVSTECKASFEREIVLAAPARLWEGSIEWATPACPNGTIQTRIRARDAAGNLGDRILQVRVLNLGRLPMIRSRSTVRLFPSAGYVELAVSDDKRRQFGLSLEGVPLAWSVAVQRGEALVLEGLSVRTKIAAPRGTAIRIAISQGVVRYEVIAATGGPPVEFYRSLTRMTTAAWVETVLEDAQTVLGYLTIAGGSS